MSESSIISSSGLLPNSILESSFELELVRFPPFFFIHLDFRHFSFSPLLFKNLFTLSDLVLMHDPQTPVLALSPLLMPCTPPSGRFPIVSSNEGSINRSDNDRVSVAHLLFPMASRNQLTGRICFPSDFSRMSYIGTEITFPITNRSVRTNVHSQASRIGIQYRVPSTQSTATTSRCVLSTYLIMCR